MPNHQGFTSSLRHALRGVWIVFWAERNFRVHVAAAVLVFVFASLLRVDVWEFILLILLSAAVLILELLNSVIERIADGLKPRLFPIVRDVKDLMAGAVLVAAATATVVGAMIFLPYLLALV